MVEYLEYRKRRVDDLDITKSLSWALFSILASPSSNLKYLEIRYLEVTNTPNIINKVSLKILEYVEGLPL